MVIKPFTVTLPDGKVDYVSENKHLVDIAEQYVGCDFAKAIEKISETASAESQYAEKKFKSDMEAYEISLDAYNTTIHDMSDVLEKMETYVLKSKRISRDKLIEFMKFFRSEINNRL